ncbi:MAG: class I SAM-dependent methyltransferase [Thermoplasmata archaeon]
MSQAILISGKSMSEGMVDRSLKVRTAEVFDQIAEHFDLTRRSPWREVVEYVESMGHMDIVADIGCGNGRHIPYLSEKAGKVLAVDFSGEMLSIARRNIDLAGLSGKVVFLLADSSRLPLKKESVDGFIYIAALHHLPTVGERLESLESLRAALKSGSRGLVSVWVLDQPRFENLVETAKDGDILVPWTMPDGQKVDRFYHLFQEEELRSLLEASGLAVEKLYRSRDNYFAEVVSD